MKTFAAAAIVMLAAAQAAPPQPRRPVPVAASTLASHPDSYYGQVVSITAPIDRPLSPTAFVIDQAPATSTPQEIVVIAPTLIAPVETNAYVTIVGEAIRFDAAEIARRAKDYTLDLAPDMIARFEGRPAVLATAVVTTTMADLAKRPPPPLTPEEEAFDELMKRIGPAFTGLRAAINDSNTAAATESTKTLKEAFAGVEAFWKTRKTADAIEWTRTARRHVDALGRAVGAGDWERVKTSADELNRSCSTCHTAYRERLEDGTFRVRSR